MSNVRMLRQKARRSRHGQWPEVERRRISLLDFPVMSAALLDPLSDIVVLSETMLSCAERGEWLELADLEAKRHALIAAAMQPPEAAARDSYVQAARRILALDQRTLALAQAGHSALAKQLQSINTGRNAVQAYAQQVP
jgi:hypothetical protein